MGMTAGQMTEYGLDEILTTSFVPTTKMPSRGKAESDVARGPLTGCGPGHRGRIASTPAFLR